MMLKNKRKTIGKIFEDVTKVIDDLVILDSYIQNKTFISKKDKFLLINEKFPILNKKLNNIQELDSDSENEEVITPKDEFNLINPFINKEIKEDNIIEVPLTIYSYFEIPLNSSNLNNFQIDNSFINLHESAYNKTQVNLCPKISLKFNRDRLISNVDKKRAYHIKYYNELLNSYNSNKEILDLQNICWNKNKVKKNDSKYLNYHKNRDVRLNSEGYRMLSNEFCMIINNKIVRPLKSRSFLNKRKDEFKKVSSPLK